MAAIWSRWWDTRGMGSLAFSPKAYASVIPANTKRNKHVFFTSKQRFDVNITHLLRCVFAWVSVRLQLFHPLRCDWWEVMINIRKLRGTIVNIILPPRVLFYRREFYFTAARFILLPRVLFYCREIYFTAASFILAPRVLFYCREF